MASQNVGKWSVTAGVDAGGFGTGVDRMMRDTQRMERGVGTSFGRMRSSVTTGLSAMASSFGSFATLAGVGSFAAMVSGLKSTLDQEIDLAFLNDQLGTTIGWLSGLRTVASENSVSASQFAVGMEFLNRRMGEARQGGAEAVEAFERLGLSIEAMEGRGFQQNFMDIARALSAVEDRSVRARTAMDLFGRGGASGMLRFVQDLDRSLADVASRGGIVSEEDLAQFQELNSNIDRMTTSLNNAWRRMLASTAEILNPVLSGRLDDYEGPLPDLLRTAAEGFNQTRQFLFGADQTGPPSIQVSQEEMDRLLAQSNDMAAAFATQFAAFNNSVTQGEAALDGATQAMERFNLQAETAASARDRSMEQRIIEQTRTPVEAFESRFAELTDLFERGYLTMDVFNRATAQALGTLERASTVGIGERRLPGLVTFGSAAAVSAANQVQTQIRDRVDTLIGVSRETRDALRDIARQSPEVQAILQGVG